MASFFLAGIAMFVDHPRCSRKFKHLPRRDLLVGQNPEPPHRDASKSDII
jgi:hypothetical protein